MAKKSSGNVSKGERRNVAKRWTKMARKERTQTDKLLDAWDAWKAGRPTPKLIQRDLNVENNALWKNHSNRPIMSSTGAPKDG